MMSPEEPLVSHETPSAWLRLRTMILLRWLALCGQLAAVLVASFGLGLDIRLPLCALLIAASALFNALILLATAENRRLTEREALLTLLFDLGQLGALLYLTGGLGNPFALLLLAPVTISATVLTLRATVVLGLTAVTIVTVLAVAHLPIIGADGTPLEPPPLLIVGTWASMVIGIAFIAIYARMVTGETFSMSRALSATQMALAREQQITALSGVVAAAAHELGTPLATIKLVSTELADELADRPDLHDDALLIRAQADRCSEILRSMGPSGKDDEMVRFGPLTALVEEAAGPHADRGIRIITRVEGALPEDADVEQPVVARRPEIIQGLRNLVQNAVDFARTTVWIDLDWTITDLRVVVGDDGPGYPPELLGRIGDPFLRGKPRGAKDRPGYESMGLGLFIAKTLLERTGARLSFGNGSERPSRTRIAGPPEFSRPSGAVASVTWPRSRIDNTAHGARQPLAANAQNRA